MCFITNLSVSVVSGGNNGGFVVNTPGCRIPDLPTWSHEIEPYIRNQYADPKCAEKWYALNVSKKQRGPPLIKFNVTAMWLVRSALQHYNLQDLSQFTCCYRSFWRTQEDNMQNYSINADNHARYSNYCQPFNGEAVLVGQYIEFVKVECSRIHKYFQEDYISNSSSQNVSDYEHTEGKNLFYIDFHAFVPLKTSVEKRCSKFHLKSDKVSVLVIGLDSVSRLNMLRQLPKTYEVLTSPPLSAISLLGYNKVGDNTFPNLIPLLTGYSEEELVSICWPTRNTKMDLCPFIWKDFAANGFRTAYGEDSTTISTFNYKKVGFIEEPTDYYARPFFYESLKQLGHVGKTVLKLCTGSRQSFEYFVDYVKAFSLKFSTKPYFAFFWSNIISHSTMNMPHIGDQLLATMLQDLQDDGALNRSVLVLMSDHGIRWGKFRETYQGRMEERLPFFLISFPKWFHKRYPGAIKNLQRNANNRLTTPFDVHVTLLELLNPNKLLVTEDVHIPVNDSKNNSRSHTKPNRGISLFLPISSDRTCEDAGISPHWCTCHTNIPVSTQNSVILNVANYAINMLNIKLHDYSNCEKLKLGEIKYAEEKHNIEEKFPSFFEYLIIFVTQPGEALFETTIQQIPSKNNVNANFLLAGPISRLNSYGNESYCVEDSTIKLYCYCKIQI